MKKQSKALPVGFPGFEGRQKALAYWGKIGRDDLAQEASTQAELFIAYHEARNSHFVSWDAAWRTWYINAARFSKAPQKMTSPRSIESMKTTDYKSMARPAKAGPL